MSGRRIRVFRVVEGDRPVAIVRVTDSEGRLVDGFKLDGGRIMFTRDDRRCEAPFVIEDFENRPDLETVATVAHNLIRTLYRRMT